MSPADIQPEDFGWIWALNKVHEVELSPLTEAEVARLVSEAAYARAIDGGAFLLVFDQTADYDSPNFLWFRERYDRFLYIDRIAVADTHRRRGLARALYEDLFAVATERGEARVVCEINSHPPNPGSDAFHLALGFEVVGEAELADRCKVVRYYEKPIG